MAEAHTLKFDQKAFNRGVEDTFTLRPLREAVSNVFGKSSSSSTSREVAPSGRSGASAQTRGYNDGKHSDKR